MKQENIRTFGEKLLALNWRKENKYEISDEVLKHINEYDCHGFTIDDLKEAGFYDNEICEIMQNFAIHIDCGMT